MINQFTGLLLDLDNEKRPDWEPQAKSLAACLKYAADTEPPPEIDPRLWHRLEHQQRSDCAGHSTSSDGEAAFTNATGQVIQFSPHFSYRVGQLVDNIQGDNGATISGCVEAAQKVGLCPLEYCPYPSSYSSPITDAMRQKASAYKIGSFAACKDYDDVMASLRSGMGINWGLGWDFTGPGGNVLTHFQGYGPGHATALLGYSTRKDSSNRNYIWLANSGYPTPGWYEVSPDAVNRALANRWTVAIAMSRLSHPEPEPIAWNPFGE